MIRAYTIPALDRLRHQQVRFAPREVRLAQIDAAERLIAEIDPDKNYPYEYIAFRITTFRPETEPNAKLAGADLLHDLRLLVEDLSDSTDVPADAMGEPVLTVEQVAKQFNVSTKTISRWRESGLVSRRFIFAGGRKRVGFLRSSVDRFVRQPSRACRSGAKFSQLTDLQRDELVEHARRMATDGSCATEVSRCLAARTGRSVETIRNTLRQFDKDHPELAIFPDLDGPLNDQQQKKAVRRIPPRRERREADEALCRTKTSIYRIINEMRAARIMELPLDCIANPPLQPQRRRRRDSWARCRSRRRRKKTRLPSGPAAVPGQPVRGAAADPRAGSSTCSASSTT